MDRPEIRFGALTIDCARDQVHALILFYTKLLSLQLEGSEEDDFPYLAGDNFGITLQVLDDYVPPTWPSNEHGKQMHMDFITKNLPEAVSYAKSIGAVESPEQYSKRWHVMLDPAGHPFCLCRLLED